MRQLIHTEQHRIFKERSRLLVRHPEAKILFSRPSGYGQILDLVEAHAYQMSVRADDLVPLEEATADWYDTEYRPAIAAIHEAKLPQAYQLRDERRHLPVGRGQTPRAADNEPDHNLDRRRPCRTPRRHPPPRTANPQAGATTTPGPAGPTRLAPHAEPARRPEHSSWPSRWR